MICKESGKKFIAGDTGAGMFGKNLALAAKKINIMVISTSEIKISVLISNMFIKKAIAALHKEFKLD